MREIRGDLRSVNPLVVSESERSESGNVGYKYPRVCFFPS